MVAKNEHLLPPPHPRAYNPVSSDRATALIIASPPFSQNLVNFGTQTASNCMGMVRRGGHQVVAAARWYISSCI